MKNLEKMVSAMKETQSLEPILVALVSTLPGMKIEITEEKLTEFVEGRGSREFCLLIHGEISLKDPGGKITVELVSKADAMLIESQLETKYGGGNDRDYN